MCNNNAALQAYSDAKLRLANYKECCADVLDALELLIDEYNQAKEAAEQLARSLGVSYEDIIMRSQSDKVDAERLLEAVGAEAFSKAGGTIENKQLVKISAKNVQLALAQGLISQAVYDEVVKVERRFSIPKDGRVP